MFDWKKKHYITAANAIYLEERDGEEGRPFKSRFLQAGLVKYDFGVCLLKKETIDKFVNTFVSCPVIIDHKDNITEADKKGVINKVWFSSEDGWYWCSGVITDEEAIKLIEDGYNVSCQYAITDYSDNTEGKLHNANPYDKEILNGVFEHLAIVEKPRYEDAFIAVNAYIATNNDFNESEHPRDEEGKFTNGSSEFGNEYKEYSNKPEKAIEHLLKEKKGFVPAAMHKEGIGDIDFIYGKTGKGGYGLAHIIEQREKQGIDGIKLIKQIPEIIKSGTVISKDKHNDRKYIVSKDKEVAIRLDYNGKKRNWIVSAYIKNELPGSNSLENWHTMLVHDSNFNVANGYVSITTPVNNSITNSKTDFNPNERIEVARNKYTKVFDYIKNCKGESMDNETKGLFASLVEALKARNEGEEDETKKEKDKKAENEDVDKRKLIDEVGGILKGKVDEELWRTIIGKIEKAAYDKSEAGTADNEDDGEKDKEKEAKNKKACNEDVDKRDIIRQIMAIAGKHEDDEDVRTIAKLAEKLAYDKSEAGTADNSKAKNKEDEEKLYEELKKKTEEASEEKAKNAIDKAVNQIYSALVPDQKSTYTSLAEGIALGEKIYGKRE